MSLVLIPAMFWGNHNPEIFLKIKKEAKKEAIFYPLMGISIGAE
jgi:hypothetical protein